MPVFDKFKCIFVHIPKTAGMSIENVLEIDIKWPQTNLNKLFGPYKFGSYNIHLQHATCIQIKELISKTKYDNYFKFAIVRNPYDRCVSQYFYIKKWNKTVQKLNFKEFIKYLELQNKNKNVFCHYMPQYKFIYQNNKLLVDYIGKFEKLDQKWTIITKKLGFTKSLPKINTTNHNFYMDYYDRETLDLVNNLFKKDFELFDYQMF